MTQLERLIIALVIMPKDLQFQFVQEYILDKYLKEIEKESKND